MLKRTERGARFAPSLMTLVALAFVSWSPSTSTADEPQLGGDDAVRARGATIYQNQCADCHGERGEGVAGAYADALVGDSSVGELATVIADTMPEGEPEACVAEDADAVAAYIHHAFYSEAAQIRNRPPRIALQHLTANQLRQSLSDLYASQGRVADVTDERGVRGIYFTGSRWKDENKKIDRVDPVLDFDFGHEGPGSEINPEEFYIYWEGSLRPDVSGEYEIIVRSTCSFIMHFGTLQREFINNNVQSGGKTEFRERLYLVAGRVYPFKIDFRQRNRSTEQPPASMQLAWVPPHQVEETIPTRNLIPSDGPATFALQTELPPDDRSYGFERGIAINRQWDESTTAAAVEFANIAIDELWPQYARRHRDDPQDNRQQLRNFLAELAETAFRGPLTEKQRQLYVDAQVDATEDDMEAIKRSLLMVLKSPRFLYPTADATRTPSQRAANRLALVLHDSLPSDRWLVQQARKGQLQNEAQLRQAAERMVNDYRTRAKTRDMFFAWLNLDHVGEIAKNEELFPEFSEAIVSDLRSSLIAFLDEVVWSETSDFRQLFQADWTMTTERLAGFYGEAWKPAEEGNGHRRSQTDAEHRFGVLTHPYLMSGLSYYDSTSPIHRGVFLIRYVLGRTLRPPTESFTPLSPDLHPDLTTRERVALQTSPESCQVCHSKINALGFVLENFDAVGRFRDKEGEKTVNPAGSYVNRLGEEIEFAGPRALADYLANSEDSMRSFVKRVFQHFVKQPIAAFGPETEQQLVTKFRDSGCNVRQLLVEIAVITATEAQSSTLEAS